MIAALFAAASLTAHGLPPEACADAPASAIAQAAAAPMREALATEQARQAALPAARDDVERILRLDALDQAPRQAFGTLRLSGLSPDDRKAAMRLATCPMIETDARNQATLLTMLPPQGWFTISRYGRDASKAAFHIIQHGDIALWRRFVPVLEKLAVEGEVDGADYGLMYDRLALAEGRPQRYGSQFRCKAGHWVVAPLEDPDHVESRRKTLGFKRSFADYAADMASNPPC